MYLYNVRVIGRMFEEKLGKMQKDKNTKRQFSWIADVYSLYISPFGHDYDSNVQHRQDGAAERMTRQIVRGGMICGLRNYSYG